MYNTKKTPIVLPIGIPEGGTAGQVLTKVSNNKYDVFWATAVSGPVDVDEILLSIQQVSLYCYTEFSYSISGDISNKDIWDSPSKTTKYFSIVYNYNLGNLTSINITRETDSFSFTRTFAYDISGNLTNITIT